MLTDSQKKLCDKLFDIGAVKFGQFPIKANDGHPERPLSPIYLNLRTQEHPVPEKRGPLDSEAMAMIGNEFTLLLDDLNWAFDLLASLPEAGTPFGNLIANMGLGSQERLTLIKTEYDDGTRCISGIEKSHGQSGDTVLVVDDLVSKADTKLEAISVLERAGYDIWLILVLVDRCMGGVDQLTSAGHNTHAVMLLTDMLDYYADSGKISDQLNDEILGYLVLAATW